MLAKDKLHGTIRDHVENKIKLTRKDLLEGYDGCARLRPVWDEIASRYDAVITPSVVDEAPVGLESTGDSVSLILFYFLLAVAHTLSQSFCGMWTILHAPALNIPGFKGENGLPIGLTSVGPRYNDMHVLHAGKAIGKVFESDGGFL